MVKDTTEILLDLALDEDLGTPWQDITTDALFDGVNQPYSARILSKHPEPVRICGLQVMKQLLNRLDPQCLLETTHKDGDTLHPQENLLVITANAKSILMAERTLLNFLRHLSGVATLTAKFVDLVAHTSCKILDTRKTTPGFRRLEKFAVACGGGVNHRLGLYDAYMVKDTHTDLIGGLNVALQKLPEKKDSPFDCIIEVRDQKELDLVLKHGPNKVTRVLLDNMDLDELAFSVQKCKNIFETEASGNLNLTNIVKVAETGVDFASVGMLTHSAEQVDLSMKAL